MLGKKCLVQVATCCSGKACILITQGLFESLTFRNKSHWLKGSHLIRSTVPEKTQRALSLVSAALEIECATVVYCAQVSNVFDVIRSGVRAPTCRIHSKQALCHKCKEIHLDYGLSQVDIALSWTRVHDLSRAMLLLIMIILFQVCMSGVAVGFVLSRAMVPMPHPPFRGIVDSISQSACFICILLPFHFRDYCFDGINSISIS